MGACTPIFELNALTSILRPCMAEILLEFLAMEAKQVSFFDKFPHRTWKISSFSVVRNSISANNL